ncbi:peptidoglycan-binding protein [Ramlibacter sp. USB13]|uniref:Peptidoglycan-binding protein n=1 Tax=Ramlibacter cellulosilyticus TaxID=2764187 RepID=A0A923MQL8_9BURK|nr:peptidoglycan-binding protein [Ramlibacter cellulosilyticus]MBC5783428.1 peptidoglycan-binding protein [Ramlibacter cellulosilyticus]
MAEPRNTAKAQLVELDEALKDPKPGGKTVTVQFNPESLKLSFSNQVQNSSTSSNAGSSGGGSGDQSQGTQGRQFVGTGTTKLAVQLWFDANAAGEGGDRVDDVRRLTQEVIYFITPQEASSDPTKFLPPGIRFAWGSFLFNGLVDGIEETIDFFSPEGKPLRANISLTLSQQTILVSSFTGSGRVPGRPRAPGTTPLTPAAAGSTLQGLAGGASGDWQGIAAANGIENPRLLAPGQLVDLSARVPRLTF